MASMSYCVFENTTIDMAQCVARLAEAFDQELTLEQFLARLTSDYERAAVRRLYNLAIDLVDTYEMMSQF